MKSVVTMILLCCSALMVNAEVVKKEARIDIKKIDSLVNEYFINKYQQEKSALYEALEINRPGRPPHCDPHNPPGGTSECVDIACTKLGSYGCDQMSEINQVTAACRGVNGDCLEAACAKLGSYGCDQMSEIEQVGAVCRSVFDSECMEVVCSKLGSYGCDQMSEIQQVGQMCRGRVDSGCIESVCSRLGSYGCDQMSELQQVAKSCGGN